MGTDEADHRPELPEDIEEDDVDWSTCDGEGLACRPYVLVTDLGWTWRIETLDGGRAFVWSRSAEEWLEVGEDV